MKLGWEATGSGVMCEGSLTEEQKGGPTPQNKFKILASRVMTCGVELSRQKTKHEKWRVECYKCGEEGHKCRECLL